jgi:hypothetical protein
MAGRRRPCLPFHMHMHRQPLRQPLLCRHPSPLLPPQLPLELVLASWFVPFLPAPFRQSMGSQLPNT